MANVSIVISAVTKGLKQAEQEIANLGKAAKKTGEEGTKGNEAFLASVKNLGVVIGATAGVVTAFGIAAKQAFDFAQEGAAIQQTTQSFEYLLDRLGQSPAYLDRLREASRGTVDDMTLMSSTMTLLAGVSDDLGREMLDAAPRILEIAKAANKLNPTLGDTAFLYQSLMTGIKRGSPLLIDNTGLTLKLGDANEMMAEKLGKSVEQLTDSEKKMAILNATLDAGSQLIAQVGNDVDSATDSFAEFETNITNLSNTMKTKAVPAVNDLVVGLNALFNISEQGFSSQSWRDLERAALRLGMVIQGNNKFFQQRYRQIGDESDAIQKQEEYLNRLIRSYERYAELRGQPDQIEYAEPIEDMVGAYRDLAEADKDFRYSLGATASDLEYWIYVLSVSESEMSSLSEETKRTMNAAQALAEADWISPHAMSSVQEFAGSFESVSSAADDARTAIQKMLDMEFPDISSKIEGYFENVKMKNAGKDVIGDVYEGIISAPNLPQGVAEEKLGDLYVLDQVVNTSLGKIDASTAAQNISENLGVPVDEAKAKIEEVQSLLQNMSTRQYIIEVILHGTYSGPNIPGASSSITGIGGSGGGGGTSKRPDQAGSSFTVPAGYPGDSFLMGVSTGERVTVTPVGHNDGGGGGNTVYFENNFYIDQGDPTAIVSYITRQMRLAQVAGSSYAG